jgi:diguanylate cyclase (GGDEF)-like protein
MSATVSDFFQKVAAMARNGWPTCSGLGGRHGSELMAVLLRIMQKEIDEHDFDFSSDNLSQHITISMGLVNFNEIQNFDSEYILKLADDRLLQAKSKGRNRIIYNDEIR